MSYRVVDLSKLVSYVAPGIFRRIDPTLESQLSAYPETYERLRGCLDFCALMGRQNDKENLAKEVAERRKFLRATLSEFAALDEAAALDLSGSHKAVPQILSLDDPRLHVVRLLRHANVHLAASSVNKTSRPATWNEHEFDYEIFYSPDIKTSIQATDQASKYRKDDLLKMIDWIESEQVEWGLDHLILRTAELYVHELLRTLP